ncbi:MAG TPA: hypothetical protein VNG90_00610 [Candidatus Acidoferrum sp.]|nr:hypothetical protein [Candidatus Acidoferrum sp.]
MAITLDQPDSSKPHFDIFRDGKRVGSISQNSNKPGLADPGAWSLDLITSDRHSLLFGPFDSLDAVKNAAEIAAELNLTEAEWDERWKTAERLGYTDATWAEKSFAADLQ